MKYRDRCFFRKKFQGRKWPDVFLNSDGHGMFGVTWRRGVTQNKVNGFRRHLCGVGRAGHAELGAGNVAGVSRDLAFAIFVLITGSATPLCSWPRKTHAAPRFSSLEARIVTNRVVREDGIRRQAVVQSLRHFVVCEVYSELALCARTSRRSMSFILHSIQPTPSFGFQTTSRHGNNPRHVDTTGMPSLSAAPCTTPHHRSTPQHI